MGKALDNFIVKNHSKLNNRILIGTPMTGLVRSEWVSARYTQTIPTNWSHVESWQWMSSMIPLGYQVPDAENLIAKVCVEGNFEWLLFIESDNVLPPNTFVKLNRYMIKGDIPIVGGLYFTKSDPPEPMVYREFGSGFYADWKLGDKVWCRGLPFGCTLIHGSIIRALWNEAPEYELNGTVTRRVFKTPQELFEDPTGMDFYMGSTTSDLNFCREMVDNKIFEKAGWPEYQKKQYPFLVDTGIYVKHIDQSGIQFPVNMHPDFLNGSRPLKDFIVP